MKPVSSLMGWSIWIMVGAILINMILINSIETTRDEETQLLIAIAVLDLKAEIAELRAELKAHDERPEWWQDSK